MDEQQTLTAAQLWEMFLPHVVVGLKEASAHFRTNCPPAQTIDWACKVIASLPMPGGQK